MQNKKVIYEEHFNQIKGYNNYLISDLGRVFSFYTKKVLKPRKDKDGYFLVDLCKNGIRKHHKIHRLVALAFIPNPENKRTINHIDGVKTNNFVDNLEWATNKENTQHALNNGLLKPNKGSKHGQAKLSEKEVLEIRSLHKTGDYYQKDLGKIFGVDRSLIGYIVRRKRWKHI